MSIEDRIPRLSDRGRLASDGLEIELRLEPEGRCVLALAGESDIGSVELFEQCIIDAESRSPEVIILDLGGLEFMDSSGMSVLIRAQDRADQGDWSLMLGNVPAVVQRLLELVGLESHFALV